MIDVKSFYEELLQNDIQFFTGVPDSLLKDICAYITANTTKKNHIITANEGAAIGLGAGYNLATKKIPFVYMQNSGIGNAVNPLLSLADKEVYAIPMILMIGWRGETGTKDEPQHVKQGRVIATMLDSMEIPYQILDKDSNYKQVIRTAVKSAKKLSTPVAILIRKGAFSPYKLTKGDETYELEREEALEIILPQIPKNSIIVSTTGKLSRELFEIRERKKESHQTDFLTVGSMGHTSHIALGIALSKPDKPVFCFDGDGAALMHLGSYAIIGSLALENYKIVIFNNEAHDSVGGQPTVGDKISFSNIAESVNITSFGPVKSKEELVKIMPDFLAQNKTTLLEVKIKKGSRENLGRPTSSPIENKVLLQNYING